MEVESGEVEVFYLIKLGGYCALQDVVPEYKGTLTLKNSKVKMLSF